MATTQQSGFAPAASPLASTIVQTPDDAIVAGFTSIPSQGDNMPAYHARPKQSDGPLPVVIVVQEIFGVHEHIRDICRRLALEGYLAIAPELYFREGDPNDFADIPTLLSGLVAKVPDSQVLAARERGNDAPGAAGSKRESRDYRLPGCRACIQRRLSPELSCRVCERRLAANVGMVYTVWC